MKTHILLIDDDQDELDILTIALQELPLAYDCMWVQSAEHTLRLLNQYTPDIIFIDYNMPKENGLTVLTEIKKIKNLQDIQVVLYSTTINEINSSMARSLGVVACIEKPSMLNVLVKQLKEILPGV